MSKSDFSTDRSVHDKISSINTDSNLNDKQFESLYASVYSKKDLEELNKRVNKSGKKYLREFLMVHYEISEEHLSRYEKIYGELPGYRDGDEKKIIIDKMKIIDRQIKIEKCLKK